jgi:predicted ATPase/class 3 adenylate cyclase/DNA-binding CsgD family transcriptional regulator
LPAFYAGRVETLTFLFTDVEGSTALLGRVGEDGYAQVLAGYRALIRSSLAAYDGREIDTQGDGFFAVFSSPRACVAAVLQMQRAIQAHGWPGGEQVRVRMGIHCGEAARAATGLVGLEVHRAARMAAVGHGGQVLVSEAAAVLVRDWLPPGAALADLGSHRLKDLGRPEQIFQLQAAGLGAGFAPLRSLGNPALPNNLPAQLSAFIGRDREVSEVRALVESARLVTLTGAGGCGKTRLALQVAAELLDGSGDGVWLAELAAVADPALVASAVAVALGIREQPGEAAAGTLARVLARQQLLVVLDNCEHVIGAAAELCAGLLLACDDVRVLATSREPLGVAGEARYRLGSLTLPDPCDLADAGASEAVALFADRARRADARFALDNQTGPAVARLVARLDGMPLAIELAAARVEALGVAQLLDRLGDRFALLAGGDRLAPGRQRSLAATVRWSYQLLDEHERRVFRVVSVFPGPFTLEAAEAVAGDGAGLAVLRLVDCSLVVPPLAGPDGRSRYVLLETLRAYGAGLLAEAGEQEAAAAALAGYALRVAEEVTEGLQTSTGEVAAARRLDAEDATLAQVLAWVMDHDAAAGLRLTVALAPWWLLRGRLAGGYLLLRKAADRADVGSDGWCAAQFWLGRTAEYSGDLAGALGHFTAVRDAVGDQGPSRVLADCLAARAAALANLGRVPEGADDGRRSLVLARELDYPAGEVYALTNLSVAAVFADDLDGALQLARQAEQIPAGIPGWMARVLSSNLTGMLIEAGDLAAAERSCAAGLARSIEAGDLWVLAALLEDMAILDLRAGRIEDAAAHLRESLQITTRTGGRFELFGGMDCCGFLCAATGQHAEAVTVWAAAAALRRYVGSADVPETVRRRHEALREARQALGPARARAAEERGAAMSPDTAAEYALMLTAPGPLPAAAAPGLGKLSARERELVILVAEGRTNAQIAAQLHISVRTVGSHLDRIRDKTGCRRRADLTRLALTAGLV